MSGNIYKNAIDKWGKEAQLFMAIEELAELQQAISKIYRNPTREVWLNAIEEMVDTEIMRRQIEEIALKEFGEDFYIHYNRIYNVKIDRLKEKLYG